MKIFVYLSVNLFHLMQVGLYVKEGKYSIPLDETYIVAIY